MPSQNDVYNNVNVNIFGRDSSSVHHHYYMVNHVHQTVISGDLDAIKKVVSKDNIDSVDQYNATPLFYAVLCKKKDVIRYLLELGADASIISGFGISPEQLAKKLRISLISLAP